MGIVLCASLAVNCIGPELQSPDTEWEKPMTAILSFLALASQFAVKYVPGFYLI